MCVKEKNIAFQNKFIHDIEVHNMPFVWGKCHLDDVHNFVWTFLEADYWPDGLDPGGGTKL